MSASQIDLIPEFPKIETLYDRDPKTFKVTDKVRCPEFEAVKSWLVTEKIDGQNLRIGFLSNPDGSKILVGGRTEKAQLNPKVIEKMAATFTLDKVEAALRYEDQLPPLAVLFGEAYGGNIQHGGNYRKDYGFRLIDVKVGHIWLKWEDVGSIAGKIGVKTVPQIGQLSWSFQEFNQFVKSKPASFVAGEEGGTPNYPMEGIVARSEPLLLDRMGRRVAWKLKVKDFA